MKTPALAALLFVVPMVAAGVLVACTGVPSKEPTTLSRGEGARSEMSIADAESVLAEALQRAPLSPEDEPLRKPRSEADVLAILKRDQGDLFRGAVAYLATVPGVRARVLEGHVELSWAEGLLLVGQVLDRVLATMAESVRREEAAAAATSGAADGPSGMSSLARAKANLERSRAAVERLAPLHAARGAEIARSVLAKRATDREGLELTARYDRLILDWDGFDGALAELARVERPESKSILLPYLRALAEAEREQHFEEARDGLRKVLAADPGFVPARVALVLYADGIEATNAEMTKLERMNAHHVLVALGKPLVDAAYRAWLQRTERRLEQRDMRGAM